MERNNGSLMTIGVVLTALLGVSVLPTRKAPSGAHDEQVR
jgi:hypothetical protein